MRVFVESVAPDFASLHPGYEISSIAIQRFSRCD